VRVTDVYKKADGRWQIIHEHVSVPVALDTGKPDLGSKP
jgi:ketosteroid isomerase-like protein